MNLSINAHEKVVITGLGVVSSIGIGKNAFWQSLKEGKSGIRPVTLFDTSNIRSKLGGEIFDFKPEEIIGPAKVQNLDRTTNLALCATKLALDDANFHIDEEKSGDVGIVLGSTMGTLWSTSEFDKQAQRKGPRSVKPAMFPHVVMCAPPSQIAIRFGIKGISSTIAAGFNSGFRAIEYSAHLLRNRHVKYVLTGSCEELCEQTYKGFHRLRLLSASKPGTEEMCAPLDKKRNGFVFGEGAVIFLLETLASAKDRGAKVYAELTGMHSENFYIDPWTSPKTFFRQVQSCAKQLKVNNGTGMTDIAGVDFISAGFNSSIFTDALEGKLIDLLFRNSGKTPAISAIKSFIGECFSASDSFQILAALFCLDNHYVYPTLGLRKQDIRHLVQPLPQKPIHQVINKSLVLNLASAMSCHFMMLEKPHRG